MIDIIICFADRLKQIMFFNLPSYYSFQQFFLILPIIIFILYLFSP